MRVIWESSGPNESNALRNSSSDSVVVRNACVGRDCTHDIGGFHSAPNFQVYVGLTPCSARSRKSTNTLRVPLECPGDGAPFLPVDLLGFASKP